MGCRAVKCPSCGADIELDETREFGFCSYCGTKVVQDKMIVEYRGAVKLDTSDELKNLYQLARRSRKNKDYDNAQKYYEQIIIKDPTSWEANFYEMYFRSLNCKVAEIAQVSVRLSNNLESTFNLLKKYKSDTEYQKKAVNEIVKRINAVSAIYISSAESHYKSIDSNVRYKYLTEKDQRKNAAIQLCYNCGDYVIKVFGDDFSEYALNAWRAGVSKNGTYSARKVYVNKIKTFDADFKGTKSAFKDKKPVPFGLKITLAVAWILLIFVILIVEVSPEAGLGFLVLALVLFFIIIKKRSKNNNKILAEKDNNKV